MPGVSVVKVSRSFGVSDAWDKKNKNMGRLTYRGWWLMPRSVDL